MKEKKSKESNILTPEQEQMRLQVVDLELKARYWKAQFEIRNFTLEAEKLQPAYDTYLEKTRVANEEAYKKFLEQLEKNKEAGLEVVEEDVKNA